mgnify:FL=1|tara:strand:+ start:569 stop:829 length:261 start_codon:yes stop_codon:yes gene_type:complete
MITLELTEVYHLSGEDLDKIFLVGDRFTVTTRNMKWGGTEREVTVINDGLCRHDGYFVAESYEHVRDMIQNKLIARDAYVARSKVR